MRRLLFFLPVLLFSFQDPTASKKCVLAGRVTNLLTGEPLRKANVHLMGSGGRRTMGRLSAHSYGGISDAQGYFRFEGVDAGSYLLSGERPGFTSTQYGAKGPNQMGTSLTLQPGQETTDLNLGLMPQSVITGRVVDEDGDPVSGVQVQVLRQNWSRGKLRAMPQNGAQTNDLGEFRLDSLQPGKYFLSAQAMNMRNANEEPAIPGAPQLQQVRTFFPEAVSMETAAAIAVAAGQIASGMDIRLQRARTFHVRGRIAGNLGSGDGDRVVLRLQPRDQSMMFSMASSMVMNDNNATKERTFDLAGASPGAYFVVATGVSNGRGSLVARQPVDVGAADVNDVIVAIVPPGSLRGRVSLEGDGPRVPDFHPQVFLSSDEAGIAMPQVRFADDGTFSIDNVSPGKYYAQINGAPEGAYLKSVRWGQQEMLGKELDFSNGASGEVDIVFRYGVAQVSGTVQIPQDPNKPASDFWVVLMPDTLNADGSGMNFTNVDQNGSFSLKSVTPGHYRAYALERMDFNQLQNPDIYKQFANRGVDIEVKEKENKQIQLAPIPADDLKRIMDAQ